MKIFKQFKNKSKIDFIRKCIYVFFLRINFLAYHRLLYKFYYFKTTTLKLGKNVRITGLGNKIKIGSKCSFYDNSIFEFSESCEFEIGSNCIISYGVIISCKLSIKIGDDVQIGEYTSIRDTTHDYSELGVPMKYNKDISKEIIIGNNVWIGRNCLIQPGSIILDGTVVGANSIVKGIIGPNQIYAGCPLKAIKNR
jgi:acetyltransferase-like isoleucine patch superfamily enzyme